jgi:hypothetical protein
VPEHQALPHLLAAQIDVAEAQAHFLADVLVQLKRQRLGAVQNLERAAHELDLAGLQIRIDGSRRTGPDHAGDLEYVFIAHPLRLGEDIRGVRIEDDLQQPLAVAQVDENDAAMVAAAMGPAGDGDDLADR